MPGFQHIIHAGMGRTFYWLLGLICLLTPAARGQVNIVSGDGASELAGGEITLTVSVCPAANPVTLTMSAAESARAAIEGARSYSGLEAYKFFCGCFQFWARSAP